MKRLLSLCLTLALSLLLIVSAFAASIEDTEIMPRKLLCSICKVGTLTYQVLDYPRQINVVACPKNNSLAHIDVIEGRVLICDNCGAYGGADKSQSRRMLLCANYDDPCYSPNPKTLWDYGK